MQYCIEAFLRADVGCGSGDQLALAARHFPRIIGVTPSPIQAARCRRRALSLNSFSGTGFKRNTSRSFTVIESTAEQCAAGVTAALSNTAADRSPGSRRPLQESPSTAVVSIDAAYHFNTRWSFLQDAASWLSRGNMCVLVDVVLPPADASHAAAWSASVSDANPDMHPATVPVQYWRLIPENGGGSAHYRGGGAPGAHQEARLLRQAAGAISAQSGQPQSNFSLLDSRQHSLGVPCSDGDAGSASQSRLASALGVAAANQVTPAEYCAASIACGFDHTVVLDITASVWRPWAQWALARQAPALLAAGKLKEAATVAALGVLVHLALAHGTFLRVVLVVAQRSLAVAPPTPLQPDSGGSRGRTRTPRRRRRRSVSFSDTPPAPASSRK